MDEYGCEAPRFMDFANLNEPEDKASIEAYFERKKEHVSGVQGHEQFEVDNSECQYSEDEHGYEEDCNDVQYYTPDAVQESDLEASRRMSVSMVCLSKIHYRDDKEDEPEEAICNSVKGMNLNASDEKETEAESKTSNQRGRAGKLTPRINRSAALRARSNSATRWTALAKPKEAQSKYISMKEAVDQFVNRTPSRFHSKPKGTVCSADNLCGPILCTVPQSPALMTKQRNRPVTAISSTDLQLKEYEEAKKFKIKANPVNRKVLGPIKPIQPIFKPPTRPEPFNLTELKKKSPHLETVGPKVFQAQPAPINSHKPKQGPIESKPLTQALTPKVLKRTVLLKAKKASIEEKPKQPNVAQWKMGSKTVVTPFSFDSKHAQIIAKKEKLLQETLEMERKKREFHSRPMPTKIYKEPTLPVKLNKKAESMESIKSNKSEEGVKPFKARPPTSLMKEPFIPKKSDRPLLEVTPFHLNVEDRIKEREKYNDCIKERSRQLEQQRHLQDEANAAAVEEELRKQRQQTIHHAKPITKYKDVPIVEPRPVTLPKTPQVVSRYRDLKENMAEPLNDSFNNSN